jgi:hypothetical protein
MSTSAAHVQIRLAYDEVDVAVLDPSTAILHEGVLRITGYVEAGGLLVKRPRTVRSRDHIPLTLHKAPVSAWTFVGLADGTGEVIAGEFRHIDVRAHIERVIPGDVVVEPPSVRSRLARASGRVLRCRCPSVWRVPV